MRGIEIHDRSDGDDGVPVDLGVAAEVVVSAVILVHAAADPVRLPHITGVSVAEQDDHTHRQRHDC